MNFFSGEVITDIEYLYGRRRQINILSDSAKMGHNKQIIGLRRFGKTSLLKSMENKFKDDEDLNVYPIYFDFKACGSQFERGTRLVYRYIIARFMARLFEDEIYTGDYDFRGIPIKLCSQWEDIFESIEGISPVKTASLFSGLIEDAAARLNKTILFLIDEYEYLFNERFDQPEGFATMRDLASKTGPNGFKAFAFWIAGAESWENFCSRTGSGELNIVDSQVVFLGGMDRESFHEMWTCEISRCPDNDIKELLGAQERFAYDASGGIPFYAKQIGLSLLTTRENPDYSIFRGHLSEMLRSLNPMERNYLDQLSGGGSPLGNSPDVYALAEKGLIRKWGDNFELTMGLLKHFLESSNAGSEIAETSRVRQLVGEFMRYKVQINNNWNNRRQSFIFEPGNEDVLWSDQLGAPCDSRAKFGEFIRALYSIVYEATKGKNNRGEEKTLGNLPGKFKRENKYFINVVGVLRDLTGGGHTRSYYRPRRNIEYEVILMNLLGSKNEPEFGDFFILQTKILEMAVTAMENLDGIVKDA